MTPPRCAPRRSAYRRVGLGLLTVAALAAGPLASTAFAAVILDVTDGHPGPHRIDVPAGQAAEACGRFSPQATVRWQFTASEPLNFNIHHHEGRAAVYAVQQQGTAASHGSLVIATERPYCWMWTNRSPRPARLELELSR